MTPTIVIARLSPAGKDWRQGKNAHDYGRVAQAVELFLPYEPATYGNIVCWTLGEGHNEASIGYYHDTRPPHGRVEDAARLIEQYRGLLQSVAAPFDLQVRKKLPNDWRDVAWRRP